jgi:hypothetical protein
MEEMIDALRKFVMRVAKGEAGTTREEVSILPAIAHIVLDYSFSPPETKKS